MKSLEVLTGDYVYFAGRENRWLVIGKTARKVFLIIVLGERPQRKTRTGLLPPGRPGERSEVSMSNTQHKEEVKKMKTKEIIRICISSPRIRS